MANVKKSWKFNKDGNYYKTSVRIVRADGTTDRVSPASAKALEKAGKLKTPKKKTDKSEE